MHYYKKNIGDYAKKAGRLTMLQHGAYTLLLDSCYDREVFPTLEDAIEWTWASSKEEIEAVEFVLKKFFTLEDGRFVQNRISEELEKYHANSETNKRIAIEREAKRKEKSTNRAPSVNEAPPNHKPRTINQEPVTKGKSATAVARPESVDQQVWDDWLAIRKAKKLPLTKTAFEQIEAEAGKAGFPIEVIIKECCLRGWAAFKVAWLKENPITTPSSRAFAGDI
jgi:uncharacterized protein YdaU (DUF1376 family)